jgi:hypothetical protein
MICFGLPPTVTNAQCSALYPRILAVILGRLDFHIGSELKKKKGGMKEGKKEGRLNMLATSCVGTAF